MNATNSYVRHLLEHAVSGVEDAETPLALEICEPKPLPENIDGTLTIAFTDGGVVERRTSLASAYSLIQKWKRYRDDDVTPDEWAWTDFGHFTVAVEKVGAMCFKRSPHAGWWNAPADQKKALAANGYSLGIMEAILSHYNATDSGAVPEFSYAALRLLQDLAATPGVSHETFTGAIRLLEGARADKVVEVARTLVAASDARDPADAAE